MANVIINQSLSPTSLIRGLSETVPKDTRRKKKAVSDKEFSVPAFGEYETLVTNNYRVKHLKIMCRHYKQKVSGNKDQLVSRMYNFLRLSSVVAVIQRFWRGHIGRDYDSIHGPARRKRDLCLNETDFFSMEPLSEVPYSQFFSYRDTDNMVYGFDILSLFNLLSKGDNNTSNPYNRKPIPRGVRKNLNRLIRLSRLVGEEVT